MVNLARPAGFDIATVLTGSGVTLLVSAGIVRYGHRFAFSPSQLYGLIGISLVVLGVVFGLLVAATGN